MTTLFRLEMILASLREAYSEALAEVSQWLKRKANTAYRKLASPWDMLAKEHPEARVLAELSALIAQVEGTILRLEKLGKPPDLKLAKMRGGNP